MPLFQAKEGVFLGLDDEFEEAGDISETELAGMPLLVEEDEPGRPVSTEFTGAILAEARQGHRTDEVEEVRRLGRGRGWLRGQGFLRSEEKRWWQCTSEQKAWEEKRFYLTGDQGAAEMGLVRARHRIRARQRTLITCLGRASALRITSSASVAEVMR